MSYQLEPIVLSETNHCIVRGAQLGGILGYHVQNRLDIGGRVGDYSKDLAGCRLLLQRLG